MASLVQPRAVWLILLLAALPSGVAAAQELSEEMQAEAASLRSRVDLFFRQLTDATIGPDRAMREIVGNGPLKERNEEIAKLIEQTQMFDQRFGAYTGHEVVSARAVGSDLIFFRYLYKGERFPVVWHFAFYRTSTASGLKTVWSLISLRFDTKIEALER